MKQVRQVFTTILAACCRGRKPRAAGGGGGVKFPGACASARELLDRERRVRAKGLQSSGEILFSLLLDVCRCAGGAHPRLRLVC